MQHTCPICRETKDVGSFDKHRRQGPLEPWNLRRCKACTHAQYKERYKKPGRRKALNNSSNNWKKANPDKHAALAREYRARNPEKVQAQNRLNYALRKGRMERGPCEVCGATERVHAHHHDYSLWYDVRWLCYVCHKLEHGQ